MKIMSASLAVSSIVFGVLWHSSLAAEPVVTVSPETTVVTEPLDAEGYPDFLAAVNARLSDGVTPQNNAAVPLRHGMGLMEVSDNQWYRNQYDRMLGIKPAGKGVHKNMHAIAKKNGIDDAEKAYQLQGIALDRPWTREELPTVAKYVDANAETYRYIHEATSRSRFYTPYVEPQEKTSPQLVQILLPAIQETREAARLLAVRANLHIGEGRIDEAMDDLIACHRLGRLVGQDGTLVGGLVGIAIDSIAIASDVYLLSTQAATPQQLSSYLERLNNLPPHVRMAEKLNYTERLMFADVVISLARGQADPDSLWWISNEENAQQGVGKMLLKQLPKLAMMGSDWDTVLLDANVRYDELVAALRVKDYQAQQEQLQEFERSIQTIAQDAKSPWNVAAVVFAAGETRSKLLSKQLGNTLVSLLMPAAQAASRAEHRVGTLNDLLKTAVAIELHHSETGEYPASLESLVTPLLPSVPRDRFSGEAFHYEVRDDGYLLYSVGPNGTDNGGSSFYQRTLQGDYVSFEMEFDNDNDDLVVRIPKPAYSDDE